jgi:hypothetical protein
MVRAMWISSRRPGVFSNRDSVRWQLEQQIVPQAVGIVAVVVAGGDHQQAEAQHLGETVLDPLRRARIVDAGGEAPGDAEARLDLTQRQQAAIGREGAAVEAGDDQFALDE